MHQLRKFELVEYVISLISNFYSQNKRLEIDVLMFNLDIKFSSVPTQIILLDDGADLLLIVVYVIELLNVDWFVFHVWYHWQIWVVNAGLNGTVLV